MPSEVVNAWSFWPDALPSNFSREIDLLKSTAAMSTKTLPEAPLKQKAAVMPIRGSLPGCAQ